MTDTRLKELERVYQQSGTMEDQIILEIERRRTQNEPNYDIGKIFRVGDKISVSIPDENWAWGYRPVSQQTGIKGTIKGFGESAQARVRTYFRSPGIYVHRGIVNVELENEEEWLRSDHLRLIDTEEYERRSEEKRICGEMGVSKDEYLRELPATTFYEDDRVKIISHNKEGHIKSIDYNLNEQDKPVSYDVSTGPGCYVPFVPEQDIELIQRGKVWTFFNNKEELSFEDIREEAEFYLRLGHFQWVQNPIRCVNYWMDQEVEQAIKEGIVDVFTGGRRSVFQKGTSLVGIKFLNREVGNRAREFYMQEMRF